MTAAIACAIRPALVKLVEIVEEENGALQQHKVISHGGFTARKNHALRELMSAQRCDASPSAVEACTPLLRRLASALKINAGLLKLHIKAVGEISDIIIGSLRDAESDGTYSRR